MKTDEFVTEESGGTKGDGTKTRWDLMEWDFLQEVADVMTFGAKKYADYNWQGLSRSRMVSALMRHIIAYVRGERLDPETGKSHLSHACCNLMFLFWKDNKNDTE